MESGGIIANYRQQIADIEYQEYLRATWTGSDNMYKAACWCGWEGFIRDTLEEVNEDIKGHTEETDHLPPEGCGQ